LSVPQLLSVLASSAALSSQEGASEPNHKWSIPECTVLFRQGRRREPVKTQTELRRHRRRLQLPFSWFSPYGFTTFFVVGGWFSTSLNK
jgi:hypothetical protein